MSKRLTNFKKILTNFFFLHSLVKRIFYFVLPKEVVEEESRSPSCRKYHSSWSPAYYPQKIRQSSCLWSFVAKKWIEKRENLTLFSFSAALFAAFSCTSFSLLDSSWILYLSLLDSFESSCNKGTCSPEIKFRKNILGGLFFGILCGCV